jgi:ABC-type branched-subunit amino acid transport system substrate-binding protein
MPRTIRALIVGAALCLAATAAWAENAPGVTDGEIKIGQTQPYSGPAAVFGAVGKAEAAYFKMIDDQGGVHGRKIILVSLDDMYDTAKTVALTKQLIEQDKVAAIFSIQGTNQNLAIEDYLNQRGIPQLFTVTGADIVNPRKHPWTIGGAPLYRIEAQIYGRRILIDFPKAKVAVLYRNDDFGKSYLTGLHQSFGDSFDQRVVKTASYEESDASIAPQLKSLQASGANVLITAATAKHAIQAIAWVYDSGWRPTHYITFTAQSMAVLRPAGLDKAKGLISATSYMDPDDPRWTEDGSLKPYNDFVAKYLPGENRANAYLLTGYIEAQAMVTVLQQCGDDLSRLNIMRQAANLKSFHPVGLLPGVSFFTSRTQYHPIVEAALERFNGQKWELFGDVMAGE